jgi:hypothetical protein
VHFQRQGAAPAVGALDDLKGNYPH